MKTTSCSINAPRTLFQVNDIDIRFFMIYKLKKKHVCRPRCIRFNTSDTLALNDAYYVAL